MNVIRVHNIDVEKHLSLQLKGMLCYDDCIRIVLNLYCLFDFLFQIFFEKIFRKECIWYRILDAIYFSSIPYSYLLYYNTGQKKKKIAWYIDYFNEFLGTVD